MIGETFGRLQVIRISGSKVFVVCECGREKWVSACHLKSGKTKSCGCLRADMLSKRRAKHMMTNSNEYKSWSKMKARCFDPNDISYKNYGGRGISVCEDWANSFETFFKDIGPKPAGFSLERINGNGNYEPGNCIWADRKAQNRNRRNTVMVEHAGKKTTIAELAKASGLKYETLYRRIKIAGESLPRALRPVGKK